MQNIDGTQAQLPLAFDGSDDSLLCTADLIRLVSLLSDNQALQQGSRRRMVAQRIRNAQAELDNR